MKSLFLRMFLSFSAAYAVLLCVIAIGYTLTNPDQIRFGWPRVGQGAVVSAARISVESYERGGQPELTRYLNSLARDTGLRGALYDSSGRELTGSRLAPLPLAGLSSRSAGQLEFQGREGLVGVRLDGSGGRRYSFAAMVPLRDVRGFWYRIFLVSALMTSALLCYLLARHVTSPVVQLRALTSRFSRGDLTARITAPGVLGRKDEVGGLALDFNHMAARIEALIKAQQRLIADVSHELRSPITRLSLALGLMRRGKGGDSRTSLARMEREVERLNTMIGQLLTLSRLECLDQPPPMESIDLAALVREVAADADFEATSMDRSVQLVECAACSTHGARDLLRSAIENVARNALKYTDPNGQVRMRLVRAADGRTAAVVVEDQGPGVPPDALDRMFEPFYRVDEARDRHTGGAGLGLAITQRIVTLHGGAVQALNRTAGGLEMRISLPVDRT